MHKVYIDFCKWLFWALKITIIPIRPYSETINIETKIIIVVLYDIFLRISELVMKVISNSLANSVISKVPKIVEKSNPY